MKHSRDCALTATEANQHLENQDQEANLNASEKNNKQPEQKEVVKKKKKHSSALLAASMWRSPVNAVSSNTYSGGGVDNTGIWTEFRETGGID